MTLVPLNRSRVAPIAATLVLAAAALASAGPTGASTNSNATGTSLCTAAKGVAHQLVQSTDIQANEALTPAQLKAVYTTIVNAEPSLLAAASGRIKTHLRLALNFVNLVDADFKKANWKVAVLAPQLPTLVPAAKKAQPHLLALKTYFNSTCHLGV
jgi:hypothetical protein